MTIKINHMSLSARNDDEPRSQTRIQSVSRAVSLLVAIAESSNGLTAKALSEKFGLSLPTTYHLLSTLWAEGMLAKDNARIFRLGPRAAVVAEAYNRLDSVPESYRDALQAIARRTGETTYLGAWRRGGVQVLDTAEGTQAVRVVGLDVGFTEDLHARASGKLLLAYASDDDRDAVLAGARLRKLTPHTITKKADLLAELAQVRNDGIAFDRQEFQLGVDCVSAPIWRGGRVAACITVSSPTHRFAETSDEIIRTLVQTTDELRDI